MAGRQGVLEFHFRVFADSDVVSPTPSNLVASPEFALSDACVRLPRISDFAGAMTLEMTLAASVIMTIVLERAVESSE